MYAVVQRDKLSSGLATRWRAVQQDVQLHNQHPVMQQVKQIMYKLE